MANKLTDKDLRGLYSLAQSDGLDALEAGERRALGRYCRKQGLAMPGVVPTEVGQPVPAERTTAVEQPQAQPNASDDLNLLRSVRWFEDWPHAAVTVGPFLVKRKYDVQAKALREFHGRVGGIAKGLTRRQACKDCAAIRAGRLKAFTPKGVFEARMMPESDGQSWSVLARYVGNEQ